MAAVAAVAMVAASGRGDGNVNCHGAMTDGPIKLTSDSGGRLLEMALQSPVYHFYYTHLHFHISYLHFLPRYKSESLWLIRPLH